MKASLIFSQTYVFTRVFNINSTHNFLFKNEPRDMPALIDDIRAALRSADDGKISISAYDTAWVALVKNMERGDGPQFPSSVDWIALNQLPDGSWGDHTFFYAHDRIINTLACIVALTSWGIHADKCEKGIDIYYCTNC